MEGTTEEAARARFEDRCSGSSRRSKTYPDDDKAAVKKILDAILTKNHLQRLAG